MRDKLLTLIEKDTDPAVRTQALSLMRSAGVAPDVDDLVGLYTAWKRDVMPDARAEALVSALATSKAAEERAGIITLGLADPDPAVAAMVVNGARSLDLPVTLPGREPRHGRLWYDKLASWVDVPRWLDGTRPRPDLWPERGSNQQNRGDGVLRLLRPASSTATSKSRPRPTASRRFGLPGFRAS
ncbi:MAG: hypothetical protein P8127_03030, partial [Acidobacteriota bacterium]